MVVIVLWIISLLLGMAGIHVPRFGSLGFPMVA
jgi:hypothetical protein